MDTPSKEESKTPDSTARDLKHALGGSIEEREKEEKTIVLKMSLGQRPEVEFYGFWNGKLVNNAINAISRAYRLLRHKAIRTNANVQEVPAVPAKSEDGDEVKS